MSGAPEWKVYDADGNYQAACKEVEAAAAVVALYGEGATIRWGHGVIVWREGKEEEWAGNSYDVCAQTVIRRAAEKRAANFIKAHGQAAYDRAMSQRREP